MRTLSLFVLATALMSMRAAVAEVADPSQPAYIANYGQPLLVASYDFPSAIGFYPWVSPPPVSSVGLNLPAPSGAYVAGYWNLYPKRDIYYAAPSTPPGMADAPLGMAAEGKHSTMLR